MKRKELSTYWGTLQLLILVISIFKSSSQDYSFYQLEEYGFIRDVEYYNNEIYILCSHSKNNSIQKFDIVNNTFKVIYSKEKLNEKELLKIKDIVFFENDLYVVSDNKLINISKNFSEYELKDDYNFNNESDKYREMENLTVRGNSLLIGSAYVNVLSRDTLGSQPITHIELINELLLFKSDKIVRVLDERNNNFSFDFKFPPILDNQNNLWFREMQNAPLKGGLAKVDQNFEIETFNLKSYSNIAYQLQPSSLDFIDNSIYIGLYPRSESGYLEGLSIYNIESNEWTYTIDFITSNSNFENISWDTPKKIKRLENGSIAILGNEFTIEYENKFLYYDITKRQEEKGFLQDYFDNLDIIETEDKYFVIRQSGILVFDKSTITNVSIELEEKYNYQVINNTIEFKNSEFGNYKAYDLKGRIVSEAEFESSINLQNLSLGIYFIMLNDEYILKFIKD